MSTERDGGREGCRSASWVLRAAARSSQSKFLVLRWRHCVPMTPGGSGIPDIVSLAGVVLFRSRRAAWRQCEASYGRPTSRFPSCDLILTLMPLDGMSGHQSPAWDQLAACVLVPQEPCPRSDGTSPGKHRHPPPKSLENPSMSSQPLPIPHSELGPGGGVGQAVGEVSVGVWASLGRSGEGAPGLCCKVCWKARGSLGGRGGVVGRPCVRP